VGSYAGNNTVKVEGLMQQTKTSTPLVQWLNRLVDLLGRDRPARKLGAPRSITQTFVSRTAAIWRSLGLNVGLAYDFFRGGRVASSFQRYCRAALTAFGDPTKISARQIANYKNMRRKAPL
jgi:hypothetical protein